MVNPVQLKTIATQASKTLASTPRVATEISEEALTRFFQIYGRTNVNVTLPASGAQHAASNLPTNFSWLSDLIAGLTKNNPRATVTLTGELTEKAVNAGLKINNGRKNITTLTLDGDKNLVRYIINSIRGVKRADEVAVNEISADKFVKAPAENSTAEMVEKAFKLYKNA